MKTKQNIFGEVVEILERRGFEVRFRGTHHIIKRGELWYPLCHRTCNWIIK